MLDPQKIILEETFKKYEILFDYNLGHYLHKKFHVNFVDNAKPVSKKVHHVPFQRKYLSRTNYKMW